MIRQKTLEKTALVQRRWKGGFSLSQISKEADLDRATVRRLLELSYGKDELKIEIAERAREAKAKAARRDQAVHELCRRGETQGDIAKLLGVSRARVSKRLARSHPDASLLEGLQKMTNKELVELIRQGDA